jgi:hypothetical protein
MAKHLLWYRYAKLVPNRFQPSWCFRLLTPHPRRLLAGHDRSMLSVQPCCCGEIPKWVVQGNRPMASSMSLDSLGDSRHRFNCPSSRILLGTYQTGTLETGMTLGSALFIRRRCFGSNNLDMNIYEHTTLVIMWIR